MEKYLANPQSSLFWKTSSDQFTNHNRCRLQAASAVTRRCPRFLPKYLLCTIILLCVVGGQGVANGFEQRQELHVHHDSELDVVRNLNEASPSVVPSTSPSKEPSSKPSKSPSLWPSSLPTSSPSKRPTAPPSDSPTVRPSSNPSVHPSSNPSVRPSSNPSMLPTRKPSEGPSLSPSHSPTSKPSVMPTVIPSARPSSLPSSGPTTLPSTKPSLEPSMNPSSHPSDFPTKNPSQSPSLSSFPSTNPTDFPTLSSSPSVEPSLIPSSSPSLLPSTNPSTSPSLLPTLLPSLEPSSKPSSQPSLLPSSEPSLLPSFEPSIFPSLLPSTSPSSIPTSEPSSSPSSLPSLLPSIEPSLLPSVSPTGTPTSNPSSEPSSEPSRTPSVAPTSRPSSSPSSKPTLSSQPSQYPTRSPSVSPSSLPSEQPSYSKQDIENFLVFQFDDLNIFDDESKAAAVLQTNTKEVIENAFETEHPQDDFNIVVSMGNKNVIGALELGPGRKLVSTELHRSLQTATTGLEVQLNIYTSVRSPTNYTELTRSVINTAFDTNEKRTQFIISLQKEDTTFNRVNAILVTVDDEPVELIENGSGTWIYIGAGIGGAAVAAVAFLFAGYRRRQRTDEYYDPDLTVDVNPLGTNYIQTSNMQDADISTLGPPEPLQFQPHFGSALGANLPISQQFGGSQQFGRDGKVATAVAAPVAVEDPPSLATGVGTRGSKATPVLEDVSQASKRSSALESISEVSDHDDNEGMSYTSEEDAFEKQFGTSERIEVIAPAGRLGVVIDTPVSGAPSVHAIKETSPLANKIQIGDLLISVDGVDTTQLSAIRVSKLIASKAGNPERHMVFVRTSLPR